MSRLTDFQRIIAMNTLSGIGMGLVGIFIPIYLLELGNSIFTVIAWLLTHHISLLIGAFLTIYLSNIVGLVRCWYVRVVLIGVLFLGLFLLPEHSPILFALAIVSGLESAFFWIPYNILTVRKTSDSTMGSSLALMSNVASAAGILIPGIAAFIIITYGYNTLFALAFLFIALSIIPVLPLRRESTNFHFRQEDIRNIVKRNKAFILPEILDNLGQDAQVVWTLFIFITALTILDIGLLGILAGLVGMFVTYITGKLIDKWDRKKLVRISGVGTTVMWSLSYIVAVYTPTPTLLYIVTILRGFILGVFASSYGVIMFNRARSQDAQFLVLREIPTILGRVVLFLLAMYFISIDQFELTFLVVAIISLYFWFNNLDPLMAKMETEDA